MRELYDVSFTKERDVPDDAQQRDLRVVAGGGVVMCTLKSHRPAPHDDAPKPTPPEELYQKAKENQRKTGEDFQRDYMR